MSTDHDLSTSRRAVLTAALGAGVATIAGAIGRVAPVEATIGADVFVGGTYTEDATTSISNLTNGLDVLDITTSNGYAINGYANTGTAFYGESILGQGLYVSGGALGAYVGSVDGYGLQAQSNSNIAIMATTEASNEAAVVGLAEQGSTGILGQSGGLPLAATVPKVGVYGHASQDGASRGVLGVTGTGTGIHGFAGAGAPPAPSPNTGLYGRCDNGTSSRGASGYSAAGTGVWGNTASGTGLYGAASVSTGYALKTIGRLSFGKVSGLATIAAGAFVTSAIATGTDITSNSYVLFSPQGDPGSRRFWATLDTTANTLTIHTNASSLSAFKVACFLVG